MAVFHLTFSVSVQCRGRPSRLVWPGAVARPSRQGPRKSGQSSRAEAARPQNDKSKTAAKVRISAPNLHSRFKKCTPKAVAGILAATENSPSLAGMIQLRDQERKAFRQD